MTNINFSAICWYETYAARYWTIGLVRPGRHQTNEPYKKAKFLTFTAHFSPMQAIIKKSMLANPCKFQPLPRLQLTADKNISFAVTNDHLMLKWNFILPGIIIFHDLILSVVRFYLTWPVCVYISVQMKLIFFC